jgi:tetratricopeptide (TPR) repeat protein
MADPARINSPSRETSGADPARINSPSRETSGADPARTNSPSRETSGADPARINSLSRETSGADDGLFQEAVEALREGNKTKARDMLTGLLKTDQNNATYWVWMSATVDSTKERIYCLQTAFKLDPENVTAKRGLILLGALPPDETIQPFSLNRPRAWEEKLLLAHEKPKLKGWAAVRASPVMRLGGIVVLVGALAGAVYFGFIVPRAQQVGPPTNTPGPSPTWTSTPTSQNATGIPQVVGTAVPLSELLAAPYTPTALYVNTPRSPVSSDVYRRFVSAFQKGDWDTAIAVMQEVARLEPESADPYYYLGECYRFKGDPGSAVDAYQIAIQKDPEFGAAYVGLARARIQGDPGANVLPLLDEAIRFDPNFGEAYLERAKVKLRDNDIQGAISDLSDADRLLPSSPLVYFTLAQARQKEREYDLALNAAKRANELDVTNLPTYLLLGQLYAEVGQNEEAGEALGIYLKYNEGNADAFALNGRIQFENGAYEESIQSMNRVISIDRNRREAYLYRFYANVELGKGDAADDDIDRLLVFYPDLFEFNIALIRAHLIQDRNGSALQTLAIAENLADTDEQKALAYFWGGVVHEERDEPDKAADYWEKLLDLPEDATTEEQREVAAEHLLDIRTATPAPTPTRTRTPSPTKPITATVTKTPTRTPMPTPTQ